MHQIVYVTIIYAMLASPQEKNSHYTTAWPDNVHYTVRNIGTMTVTQSTRQALL